ncbi:hypothetical protein RJ55_07974 [Drechmeria coniospora]|nr:hypothetical protein RJ55_07974 [Drechmeria coniospora]
MSTNAQDQDLVADAAAQYGIEMPYALGHQSGGSRNDFIELEDMSGEAKDDGETVAIKDGGDRVVKSEFIHDEIFTHETNGGEGTSGKGISAETPSGEAGGCRLVPSFGWHPWYSHLLYDDTFTFAPTTTYTPPEDSVDFASAFAAKKRHYEAVLTPSPERDDDFIASLPVPTPLSAFIAATRARLRAHPYALVGEIGLDKAFRVPFGCDASAVAPPADAPASVHASGHRTLSRYRVRIQHQEAIFGSQVRLAAAEGRPVSVHCVQAHGSLHCTFLACCQPHERPIPIIRGGGMGSRSLDGADSPVWESLPPGRVYPPRICLHSFTGDVQVLQLWLHSSNHTDVYFSFSKAVNLRNDSSRVKSSMVMHAVPDDRALLESDLPVVEDETDAALEEMYRHACHVKQWPLEEGVRRFGSNFESFIFGNRMEPVSGDATDPG